MMTTTMSISISVKPSSERLQVGLMIDIWLPARPRVKDIGPEKRGGDPRPPPLCSQPALSLPTSRGAFLKHCGIRSSLGASEHTAALGCAQAVVRDGRRIARRRRACSDCQNSVAQGLRKADRAGRRGTRGRWVMRRRVRGIISEVAFLRGYEVTQIGLHAGNLRLVLRVGELRDRDGGKNADDHDHDQQLDQGKALAVAHTSSG